MNNKHIFLLLKSILKFILGFIAIYLLLLGSDRFYGRHYGIQSLPDSIVVEQGDIIFRITSCIMAKNDKLKYGALPGHLAIALDSGKIATNDGKMGQLRVAEFGFLNRHNRTFQKSLSIKPAYERFSFGKGRRFLLKTHLTQEQKQKLLNNISTYKGYPYSLWASKEDTCRFHCASFVWSIFKKSIRIDLDSDGGKYVFPIDILEHQNFKTKKNRIRF